MSAEAATLIRTHRVGHRRATWTVPPIKPGAVCRITVDWWPDEPHRLAPFERRQYRAARNAVMREVEEVVAGLYDHDVTLIDTDGRRPDWWE